MSNFSCKLGTFKAYTFMKTQINWFGMHGKDEEICIKNLNGTQEIFIMMASAALYALSDIFEWEV